MSHKFVSGYRISGRDLLLRVLTVPGHEFGYRETNTTNLSIHYFGRLQTIVFVSIVTYNYRAFVIKLSGIPTQFKVANIL